MGSRDLGHTRSSPGPRGGRDVRLSRPACRPHCRPWTTPSTRRDAPASRSATGAGWSGSGWAASATRWSARRPGSDDGWLAARGGTRVPRAQRAALPAEHASGPQILETPDVEATRIELKRLLMDIQRHMQRLNDLAYDEVEMELGGSE